MIHEYTLKDWRRVTVRSCWTVSGNLVSFELMESKKTKQWYIPVISYWCLILHFICDDYQLVFLGQGAHGLSLKVIILLTKCNNHNLSILLCISAGSCLHYNHSFDLIHWKSLEIFVSRRIAQPSSLSNTIFADDCIIGT